LRERTEGLLEIVLEIARRRKGVMPNITSERISGATAGFCCTCGNNSCIIGNSDCKNSVRACFSACSSAATVESASISILKPLAASSRNSRQAAWNCWRRAWVSLCQACAI